MDWVILDGFDCDSSMTDGVVSHLRGRLEQEGKQYAYFKLREMNIAPCRSCGACSVKSPGKCIVNDDMPSIMRVMAPSRVIVLLTPVRFGGYSSQLRKATDKFMGLGLPFYMVKSGHLFHPMRYELKSLVAIGLIESSIMGQEDVFRLLVERNAMNMQCPHHRTMLIGPTDELPEARADMDCNLEEALRW